jgi:hypothetical protein
MAKLKELRVGAEYGWLTVDRAGGAQDSWAWRSPCLFLNHHFNFWIEEEQMTRLRQVSQATGVSMAHQLRKYLESLTQVQGMVLSGATVLGIYAHTTSGQVWIGKGA